MELGTLTHGAKVVNSLCVPADRVCVAEATRRAVQATRLVAQEGASAGARCRLGVRWLHTCLPASTLPPILVGQAHAQT